MSATEHYKKLLHRVDLKATPARISILTLLEQESKPMSAKELVTHTLLHEMDQATLYRNLQSLMMAGLIRQIDLQGSHRYYEISSTGDHHHIVCVHCGKIEEVEGCHAQPLAHEALTRSRSFAKVLRHSLEFFGICQDCATDHSPV